MFEQNSNEITFLTNKWPLSAEKPTILFIHGAGNSSTLWKHQVENLSGEINAVAIDLPGHGRSSKEGLDSISGYAQVVEQFIEEAKIPCPIPCGLSMGGAISLQLLLNGGEKYSRGILINSGAKLRVMPMIFDMIKNDFTAYANSFDSVAISPQTDKKKLEYIVEGLRNMNPETVYNDFMACDSFNVMDRLGEITVPVLVLTAEDDKLAPPKYGTFLADALSNASLTQIPGAGHMSPVEKPEAVNSALLSFIHDSGLK
ncbi:MAG: alpha/beta hydrolase [bacterium]|nr:alpha/beta hydrolase [bacterium]